MSNVLIGIASEFDAKGFKQAEKSTSALDKNVKKLGKTLLGVFSAQKIMQYSKASVLAYANDQKAAALLSNQLKNLGLSYSAVGVEKFIADLQTQTGILDDELRPAFTDLVRVTGSVAKTQQLMMTAFDASRGAGIEYSKAIQLISRAYVGNYKGLKQLNLGLSDAELKTKSFDQILTIINDKFRGAGAASVDTYAGKIDLLKVSLANTQEIIGKGFVDAFEILSKDKNFNDVTRSIEGMATGVADAMRGIATLVDYIDMHTPDWIKKLVAITQKTSLYSFVAGIGANQRKMDPMTSVGTSYYSKVAADKQAAAAAKKLAQQEKIRLTTTKKITAEKKAQTTLDKSITAANLLLYTAQNIFDLERIGVAAALQNKTLTENEIKRLEIKEAMFALEDAIEAKDEKRIELASKLLGGLSKQFAIMQDQDYLLANIKATLDVLGINVDLINIKNLQEALGLLRSMSIPALTVPGAAAAIPFDYASSIYNPFEKPTRPNMSNVGTNQLPTPEDLNAYAAKIAPGEIGISFTVTDNAKNLVDIIMETVTEQSASGNPPIVTRIDQNLAW
jgi:hypothetical protein